jgi:hypothetical protein
MLRVCGVLVALIGLCLLLAVGPASACPTCLNIIPTAQILDWGTFCLQAETDGHTTPVSGGATASLLGTVGVLPRLEVGFTVTDLAGEQRVTLDAKWLLWTESLLRPALAVGVLDLNHAGLSRERYLVATKSLPGERVELTAGLLDNSGVRAVAGASVRLDDADSLYADYTSGTDGFATIGFSRDLGHSWSGLLYGARSNTATDANFIGLNFTWTGGWR